MLMMETALLALALAVGPGVVPQQSPAPAGPPLRGTFLQFQGNDRWTDAKLRELFLAVRPLGLSRIIVQWTVVGTKAFYSSSAFESLPDPPLERLLALADQYGVAVRVGLAHDPEFWDRIKLTSSPHDIEIYLKGLRQRSTAVARELLPVVSRHPSFEGWFLTEEVDDVNWLAPERRVLLRSYLGDLRKALRALGSSASVAVSGFSNAHCDPSTLEQFWRELISETSIDVVFFQDGVGAHKLELPYLPLYLAAMKRAAMGAGATLSIVVELFDQVGGSPVTEGPFRAEPATVDRVARQLTLAIDASTGETLAFSVPDYMLPTAGAQAQRLYGEYVKRYCGQNSGIPCPSSANEAREVAPSAAPSTPGKAREASSRVRPMRAEGRVGRAEAVVYDSRDSGVTPPTEVRPHVPTDLPAAIAESEIAVFELVIDESGKVESVQLVRPRPLRRWDHVMQMSSMKAWQFQPAMKDGRPVKYRQQVRIWAPAY